MPAICAPHPIVRNLKVETGRKENPSILEGIQRDFSG